MTIDRIENGIAVIENEDGGMSEIPLSELPDTVREGSVIVKTAGGYIHDRETEGLRRKRLSERTRRIFKRK